MIDPLSELAEPWYTLQIAPTAELRAIKRAYAARIKQCRPDEDPQGFQQICDAYQWAQAIAPALAGPALVAPALANRVEPDADVHFKSEPNPLQAEPSGLPDCGAFFSVSPEPLALAPEIQLTAVDAASLSAAGANRDSRFPARSPRDSRFPARSPRDSDFLTEPATSSVPLPLPGLTFRARPQTKPIALDRLEDEIYPEPIGNQEIAACVQQFCTLDFADQQSALSWMRAQPAYVALVARETLEQQLCIALHDSRAQPRWPMLLSAESLFDWQLIGNQPSLELQNHLRLARMQQRMAMLPPPSSWDFTDDATARRLLKPVTLLQRMGLTLVPMEGSVNRVFGWAREQQFTPEQLFDPQHVTFWKQLGDTYRTCLPYRFRETSTFYFVMLWRMAIGCTLVAAVPAYQSRNIGLFFNFLPALIITMWILLSVFFGLLWGVQACSDWIAKRSKPRQ